MPQRRRARSDASRTREQLSSQLLAALTAKRARVDLSALAPQNLRRACVCLVGDMHQGLAAAACAMCSSYIGDEANLGAAPRCEVRRARVRVDCGALVGRPRPRARMGGR